MDSPLDGTPLAGTPFDGPQWLALAGVGVGYGLACAAIFLAFFLLPYLALAGT